MVSEASRERPRARGEAKEAAVALSPFQSTARLASLDGFFFLLHSALSLFSRATKPGLKLLEEMQMNPKEDVLL